MEFGIRALREDDAERVAEMAAALSAHEGMPPPPFGSADVMLYGFGENKRFDGIVAETESGLIGYTLFIDSFYVEDQARGTGAGRALMGAVAAETIARGGSWIVWQSLPTNKVAIDFYTHIGSRQYQAADFELSGMTLTEMAAESNWR